MQLKKWVVGLVMAMGLTSGVRADLPQGGDVVLGLASNIAANAMELARGAPVMNGGAAVPDIWTTQFVQSVEFDNLGGVRHNAQGNLLGATFGATATGGTLFNFSTTNAGVGAGQLIYDFTGTFGTSVVLTRWGGLSVSPSNNRIALTGRDTGAVIVFDYTAGDTMGANASVSGGRETALATLTSNTNGTTWLDNDTVLALSGDGKLFEVDASVGASPLPATQVANLQTPQVGSDFTSLAYNPTVSPFIYASYSGFNSGTMMTTNKLYVLDPASAYNVVKTIDLSTSAQTLRELAIGPNGVLYMGQFGGTGTPGAKIDILTGVDTPLTLTDNSSIDWFQSALASSFSGLDLAFSPPSVIDGDFNNDGQYNCLDIDALTGAVATGGSVAMFDLNGDNMLSILDVDSWRSEAGGINLGAGRSYRVGDATLDGVVDGSDFGRWNTAKFTNDTDWCDGNFNADLVIDGSDFGLWNGNKFTSSDGGLVPEPVSAGILAGLTLLLAFRRR